MLSDMTTNVKKARRQPGVPLPAANVHLLIPNSAAKHEKMLEEK
jgi:hypothetical protein